MSTYSSTKLTWLSSSGGVYYEYRGSVWLIIVTPSWVFPKIRGTPKWTVYRLMENPIKMDDLGVPLFSETSSWFPNTFCLIPLLEEMRPFDFFLKWVSNHQLVYVIHNVTWRPTLSHQDTFRGKSCFGILFAESKNWCPLAEFAKFE